MSATAAAESVDLAATSVRELNQRLHDAAAEGGPSHWRISNPSGAHAVAVGLDGEMDVEIEGHVGYYCAGMNKLATVRVEGNAGTGVAENIMSVCSNEPKNDIPKRPPGRPTASRRRPAAVAGWW